MPATALRGMCAKQGGWLRFSSRNHRRLDPFWRQRISLNALNISYMPPLHLEMFHNHNYPSILTPLVQFKQTNGPCTLLAYHYFCFILDPSSMLFLPLLSFMCRSRQIPLWKLYYLYPLLLCYTASLIQKWVKVELFSLFVCSEREEQTVQTCLPLSPPQNSKTLRNLKTALYCTKQNL